MLKCIVFARPPISLEAALVLIRELQTAPILDWATGQPPANIGALAALVSRVSRLALVESAIEHRFAQRRATAVFNPILNPSRRTMLEPDTA